MKSRSFRTLALVCCLFYLLGLWTGCEKGIGDTGTDAPGTSAAEISAPEATGSPETTTAGAPENTSGGQTAEITTVPLTAMVTTPAETTPAVTAAEVTSAPVTAVPVTTVPLTTVPVTTVPVTTVPVTTVPVTTVPVTTVPVTASAPATTAAPETTAPSPFPPATEQFDPEPRVNLIFPADRVHYSGSGSNTYVFENATADDLQEYVDRLGRCGFLCLSDRTVNGSRFTSFLNETYSVTAYYTKTDAKIKICVEPAANRYTGTAAAGTSVQPMLTMIGRKYNPGGTYLGKDASSGLSCFMIRLPDGRFLVVDGGENDRTGEQTYYSTALYNAMRAQAPDPDNIVIAAWFFTHSHSDHTCGFRCFIQKYASKVTVEALIHNFPSREDWLSDCDQTILLLDSLQENVAKLLPDTPIYKMHTGQQYSVGGASVTVWATQEDFVSAKDTPFEKNWNNTSAIFSVDVAGQRIMFLGDAQTMTNNWAAAVYGSAMQSDIVQIAHHGGVGGTEAIYEAVNADVALFTTSEELVAEYIRRWKYNAKAVELATEYFNASDRVTTFRLPYTPKSKGYIKTTDN